MRRRSAGTARVRCRRWRWTSTAKRYQQRAVFRPSAPGGRLSGAMVLEVPPGGAGGGPMVVTKLRVEATRFALAFGLASVPARNRPRPWTSRSSRRGFSPSCSRAAPAPCVVTCHAGNVGARLSCRCCRTASTTWSDARTRRRTLTCRDAGDARQSDDQPCCCTRWIAAPAVMPSYGGGKHWLSQADPGGDAAAWVRGTGRTAAEGDWRYGGPHRADRCRR